MTSSKLGWWRELARAPEDEGGAGGGEGGGGEGGEEGGADEGGEAGGGEGGGGESGGDWWADDRFDEATQTQLKALGLTVDDPLDAVSSLAKMERDAKAKFGKGVDAFIEKPGEGKDVGEWLRANGDMFGIPENPEGYEIKPPEGWPEGQEWDADFEAEARKIAHEAGVPAAALQKMTDLYAGKVAAILGNAQTAMATARSEMMADLHKDWGDQTGAKLAQVAQISGVLAEAAGLDEAAMAGLAKTLKDATGGDANTIRLFAAIADMAGDDSAVFDDRGGQGGAMTPALARQRIEEMKAPDSDYRKAMREQSRTGKSGNYNRLHKEWRELHRIANPG